MILNALIIALMVYFIKATTWKGHIFEWVDDLFECILTPENYRRGKIFKGEFIPPDSDHCKRNGKGLYKPIIGCNMCMTPWWGFLIYSIAHWKNIPGFEVYAFWRIIFTLFIAGGFAAILLLLGKLVTKVEDAAKEIKNLNENYSI